MKNLLFTVFTFLPIALFAQGDSYGKGLWNIYVGAGFPNITHTAIDTSDKIFNINGDDNGSSTPFYMASANYGVNSYLDIGIFGGYFESESEILAIGNIISSLIGNGGIAGTTEYSVFSIGGKATVHEPVFGDIEKLDTYASTYLGYNIVNDDIKISSDEEIELPIVGGTINVGDAATAIAKNVNYPKFTYDVNVGAKYNISDNFNIYGEAGYGRFLVNMGLAYTVN